MISTTRPAEPRPGTQSSTIGQALEHQRVMTKTRRLEGVVAALQVRRRERALRGVVPPPLDQALEDFASQLAALKARTEALSAGRNPVPPPGVA